MKYRTARVNKSRALNTHLLLTPEEPILWFPHLPPAGITSIRAAESLPYGEGHMVCQVRFIRGKINIKKARPVFHPNIAGISLSVNLFDILEIYCLSWNDLLSEENEHLKDMLEIESVINKMRQEVSFTELFLHSELIVRSHKNKCMETDMEETTVVNTPHFPRHQTQKCLHKSSKKHGYMLDITLRI